MDDQKILSRAMAWMHQRNWREKLAKGKSGQSLYEHSLIELDVFLQLAPIFRDPKHYDLSELEENILMVSLLVHDAGKATDAWQAYVKSAGTLSRTSHIVPELSEKLVPEICAELGLADISSEVHRVMINCAGIHHNRPGQSDAAVIETLLTGASDRFVMLADLVKAIDHICSADSASEAAFAGNHDAHLQKHLRLTAHELIARGISTTLLHRAAQRAFEQAGWTPLLYFATGTAYVVDLNSATTVPSTEDIRTTLKDELDIALKRDVAGLVVGSPTGNILPKPDLLSFTEMRQYLSAAGQKIGPQSFVKKKIADRRKVIEAYLKFKGQTEPPSDAELERQSGRITVAQPEMLVFKFFKAAMDPNKVHMVRGSGEKLARQKYEAIFGTGSWEQLQSTSTLMPAKDMVNTVDRFWELPGSSMGHPEVLRVEQLPDRTRLDLLVGTLSTLATSVFEHLKRPSPRDALAAAMAQNFIADLVTPKHHDDIKTYASAQLNHYRQSKPSAGKELTAAVYLCPVCSKPFDGSSGVKASADFIDNPQTHTNRGTSHGSFGYVMVCSTCYHERILQQVLMGKPVEEIIELWPRLNLGPSNGERLVQKVREWADLANGANGVSSGFSMSLTGQAARRVQEGDPYSLGPEELVRLFRFRYAADTQKKREREALKLLKAEFDDDLTSLNVSCSESFSDWDDVLKALMADEIDQPECKAIRRQAFKLGEGIELMPQTPNVVLIPLRYEIASGNQESDSNKALRRLYVALILSVVFDAAVSIKQNVELSNLGRNAGVAYVPPVPAVRSLIRKEWIDVSEARYWISAIGAASILARDAELPVRSSLYQALSAEPAEKLVRRIDAKGRAPTPLQLMLISQLPGFHAGQPRGAQS